MGIFRSISCSSIVAFATSLACPGLAMAEDAPITIVDLGDSYISRSSISLRPLAAPANDFDCRFRLVGGLIVPERSPHGSLGVGRRELGDYPRAIYALGTSS